MDLGSLSAFLGDAGPAFPPKLPPAAPAAAPRAAVAQAPPPARAAPRKREPRADGTVLNKKVAFKMLRQLGCEVRGVGPLALDGEPYIEVSRVGQPVLFQMLLDFGYETTLGEDGAVTIRVTDSKRRSQEEIVASLTRPRQAPRADGGDSASCSEADCGWPATAPRPRLRPEEEQELVRRLAAPRPPKQPQAEQAQAAAASREQHKFRSKADQQAHLERLLRPRGAAEDAAEDSSGGRAPPQWQPLPPRASSGVTWPPSSASSSQGGLGRRPSAAGVPDPSESLGLDGASSSSSSTPSLPHAVRPSPRLAQAGLAALTRAASSASVAPRAPLLSAGGLGYAPRASSAPPPGGGEAASPAADAGGDGAERGQAEPVPAVAEEEGQAAAAPSSEPPQEDWLDRLLGPAAWPGRPAAGPRNRAEQRERTERLAKPKPRRTPEEIAAEAAEEHGRPPRSPRSQREACSRLAEPRKKAPPKEQRGAFDAEPSRLPPQQPAARAAPRRGAGSEGDQGPLDFSAYAALMDPGGAGSLVAGLSAFAAEPPEEEAFEEEPPPEDWAEAPEEPPEEGEGLVVIPSILAQCSGRLARIDEEPAAAARRQRRRAPARARSVPLRPGAAAAPPAGPYAAPVVPAVARRHPAGAPHAAWSRNEQPPQHQQHHHAGAREELWPEEEEEAPGAHVREARGREARGQRSWAQAPEDPPSHSWAGEEMLEDIDRLYNQLLGEADHDSAGSWEEAEPRPASAGRSPSPAEDRRSPQAPEAQASPHSARSAASGRPPEEPRRPPQDDSAASAVPAVPADARRPPPAARAPSPRGAAAATPARSGSTPARSASPAARSASPAVRSASPAEREPEEDMALLEGIDRLYSAMLREGSAEEAAGMGGDAGAAEADGQAEAAPSEEAEEEEEVDEDVSSEEFREMLQETLWSALLTARGSGGEVGVQDALLQVLPPAVLGRCVRVAVDWTLPGSLSRGLASELPLVHAALQEQSGDTADDGAGLPALARLVRRARDRMLSLACDAEVGAAAPQPQAKVVAEGAGATMSSRNARLKPRLPPRPPRRAQGAPGAPRAKTLPRAAPVGGPGQPLGGEAPARTKRPVRRSAMSYWTESDFADDDAA